jgi:integrase
MPWLYKRKESDNWWIGYRVNGKQVLESTKTSDKAKAEKMVARMEAAALAVRAGTLTEEYIRTLTGKAATEQNSTLQAMLAQWLTECKDLSGVTLKRYRNVTGEFCTYVKATDEAPLLGDIQKETIARFLRSKRSDTSAANAKLYRKILASFFNWCMENEALANSPMPSTKSLKLESESGKVRRPYTLDELKLIYGKAPDTFWQYMIQGGYYVGPRMGDLICAVRGTFDFERHEFHFRARKTGRRTRKTTTVPLHPEFEKFMVRLIETRGVMKPSDYIWPKEAAEYIKKGAGGFSNKFYDEILVGSGLAPKRTHQKVKDAGGRRTVNELSFHCLRHTFVSLLKLTGASQSAAKELAGHNSDAISDIYTHVDTETKRKAIAGLPQIAAD